MTQYLLSVYQPDGPVPEPGVLEKVMGYLNALNRELKAAGAWVFVAGLYPPDTATVVGVEGGAELITDGPYAEGKEHIGGFTVIEAPDLDAALVWAGRMAKATTLPVEVRPMRERRG